LLEIEFFGVSSLEIVSIIYAPVPIWGLSTVLNDYSSSETDSELNDKTQKLLTFFLGFTGVHRLRRKQYRSSIGYLLTFGLFGIGWMVDAVRVLSSRSDTVRVAKVKRPNYRVAKVLCYSPLGVLGLHRYYLSLGRQMFVSTGILLIEVIIFVSLLSIGFRKTHMSTFYLLLVPWAVSLLIWTTDVRSFKSLWETAEKDYQDRLAKSEGNARDILQLGIEGYEWELKDEHIDKQQMIGSGATSVVYYGTLKKSIPIAVKQLLQTSSLSGGLMKIVDEAMIHSRLRHPNVIILYGVWFPRGGGVKGREAPCLVTEYMHNGTLFNSMEKRLLNSQLSFVGRIALDICSGLNYLHSNSILHRDLKSLNVLVSCSHCSCHERNDT